MKAGEERSQGSLSLFGSLVEVGKTAETELSTWSQGLAFHYHNLLEGLKGIDKDKKNQLLTDIWRAVAEKAPKAIKEKLGIGESIDLDAINDVLSSILQDPEHPAVKGAGKDANEALLNWVRLFALLDFNIYMKLEKHIGTKEGYPIYMGLWEAFALHPLEDVKKALGISTSEDVNMDKLGELSKIYWESIACPYRVTRHDDKTHEAEILCCPYWDNMRELLGEDVSRSMTLKCEAAVSTNYYEAILKALGVFDRFSFTMDKFLCCGDNVCRVRFEKRQ